MATSLQFSQGAKLTGTFSDTSSGTVQVFSNVLPGLIPNYTNGTGSFQVNQVYCAQRALAATTFDLLDMAGSLTNLGGTITFTKIKYLRVEIVSPDGTKVLRVGPQNQSNPVPLGWGGTGATVYREVYYAEEWNMPYAGFTVTAGTGDILPIYNPGATSVTYAILIAGLS